MPSIGPDFVMQCTIHVSVPTPIRRKLTLDVCAAFAASFLLRIARLFPHELNLKRTAKDVEELANVLAEGETSPFQAHLQYLLAVMPGPCG